MTVAALVSSISYLENGVTLGFAAPFRFLPGAIAVSRVLVSGAVVNLTAGVDFSTLGGETDAGGTVTLVSSVAGAKLRIRRRTARTQGMDYTPGDRFPAESHEAAIDRAMMIDQEQDDAIADTAARALLVPDGETAPALPAAADRANKYPVFGPDGKTIIMSAGTGADGGLRADLGASGGGLVGGLTAAIAAPKSRSLNAKLRDFLTVLDQDTLLADGAADDAAALQVLLSDASATAFDGLDRAIRITSGLTLMRTAELRNLKLKPVTTGNMTALRIGPTAPDATTTLSVNAAETAVSVTLTSVTGFAAGKLIVFDFNNPTWIQLPPNGDPLAANYRFVTRIVGVVGSAVELQDNLPHAIQAGWTHSVSAWSPVKDVCGTIELDQAGHGQKRTITAISKANPAVVTANGHGYADGTIVTICGPNAGMTDIHGVTAVIQNATTNTFELAGVNSTGFPTYVGGATVRQFGVGLDLACVDSPDLDIYAYDNDGLGSAVRIGICYNPRIRARTRNCGSDGAADIQAYCWTGGIIEANSDDPAGFGATLLGGHYGVAEFHSSPRAETGRGFKTGKTKNCTYYGGGITNPAFTGLSITWVTQSCTFVGFQVRGSVRAAIQPVGIWTSQCYNINNKLIGCFSRGSTTDVQINSTDSVELIGCEIGTLDMPSGAAATQIGGSVDTVSGVASGSLKYLRADGIALSGNQAIKLTDAVSGFPLVLFGSGPNASAWGTNGSGDGQVFTDRTVITFRRGAPTAGNTNISLVYHNGSSITFQPVTLGAADSGGSGFKTLRVPN